MSYATLMVCLQAGRSHEPLLGIVETLATRFRAAVIGIGACQLTALSYGEGYATSETHEALGHDLLQNLKSADSEFRRILGGRGESIEWRDCITEARSSAIWWLRRGLPIWSSWAPIERGHSSTACGASTLRMLS